MEIIEKIIGNLDSLMITVVLATWCRDSREQFPRFLHITDSLKFNDQHITMIGVNRKKTSENPDISDLNIERVPTFIFYRNKNEIGRIIETLYKTLEWDFLHILIKEKQMNLNRKLDNK